MRASQTQQGMVLLITLALLLAMTALGVGVVQFARREAAQVEREGTKLVANLAAESCVQESMQWLEQEGVSAPPCENQSIGSQCGSTISKPMSNWSLVTDGGLMQANSQASNYQCSIYVASREQMGADSGAGFEAGQTQGYGQSQILTKYLYRIVSQATGPDGASVRLEVVSSMVY